MRSIAFLFIGFLFCAFPASADDSCAAALVPDARLVGRGEMKVALWHVYDAALYGPAGKYAADKPFALKLVYRQNVKAHKIVDTSIREMKKNGLKSEEKIAQWRARMTKIFPDIAKGDSLTGVYAGDKTVFCQDGRKIGVVEGRAFAEHFFGIWLSSQTSAPDLRVKLLGKT